MRHRGGRTLRILSIMTCPNCTVSFGRPHCDSGRNSLLQTVCSLDPAHIAL